MGQPGFPSLPSYNPSRVGQRKPLVLRPLRSVFEIPYTKINVRILFCRSDKSNVCRFLTNLKEAAGVETSYLHLGSQNQAQG